MGAFVYLVALVLGRVITSRLAVGGAVGYAISSAIEAVTVEETREIATIMAPESDPEALDEVSKVVVRLMQQDEVLWPTNRQGERIKPSYMILDLNQGRAWFSSRYHSRKSVNAGFKRGIRSGERAQRRALSQESQIHKN